MSLSVRNVVRVSAVLVSTAMITCDGFSSVVHQNGYRRSAPLHMRTATDDDFTASLKRTPELSAVAISAEDCDPYSVVGRDENYSMEDVWFSPASDNNDNTFLQDWMLPVLSTSFLITANTVGATCLVIPELAAGPGFGPTCALSIVTYFINLVSGLIMAEVAIKRHESSGAEAASSFKDFADASFSNPLISNAISWVSILTNASVLTFTFSKAGSVGSELLGGIVDPTTVSFAYVGLVGVLMSSLTGEKLSAVASVCVAGLFASFAGLLLPGLAAVSDPVATAMAPGLADNCLGAATQAFPILLLSLVYQNIVPSVTKILKYDRKKTTASLALGSFIPLAMYLAWCFASMGGGIDTSVDGWAGPLLTGFSMATIAGSSVGTTMSVAEEFDSFLKASTNKDSESSESKSEDAMDGTQSQKDNDVFSVPAVAASVALPLAASTMFGGDDVTFFLGLAGSIGTPVLYGVVPALMAWNQRREEVQSQQEKNLVPGGMASLGGLGLASTALVGQELVNVMVTSFTA